MKAAILYDFPFEKPELSAVKIFLNKCMQLLESRKGKVL